MAIMITVRVYTCLLWLVSGALRGVAGRCGALRGFAGRCGALRYKAVPAKNVKKENGVKN